MFRRRTVHVLLCLLATILVGTVLVLSSISYYLAIDNAAYITESELGLALNVSAPLNVSVHDRPERIPRIIHQTWKSETMPPKWVNVSQGCRDMMPDYEYKLWTDASAREFIAEEYPWFLDTFDGYTYPIQRADAIRYFILYHYGGIYMDLDIGCLQRMDPLLVYPVILAKTIPVGVSNDLIFAEKGHPFMAQTIHNLIAFDYSWVLNYPTVMFSTGPMFLSAQYGYYTSTHPPMPDLPGGEVRVLPKSLYGKNAKPGEAPHSFFSHFYGSSWHADDAAFIGFLAKWGKGLMWVGLVVFVYGVVRLALAPSSKQRNYSLRRVGNYEVLMPRWTQRNGRWYLDLGWFALPASGTSTQPTSPISLPSDASSDVDDVPLLPVSFSSRAVSPAPSEASTIDCISTSHAPGSRAVDVVRRAGSHVMSSLFGTPTEPDAPSTPSRARRPQRRSRGVLFFLPAFTSSPHIELPQERARPPRSEAYAPVLYPPEKQRYAADLERAGLMPTLGAEIPEHGRSRAGSAAGSSASEGPSNTHA
ncbi:glycosyltransferase family 32 protein [Gelatoporia subvermispora B]|uniref:Glycosyltransferase family 32 protein n=1 Tax=Ceriporiopsis subvermispora (strain B) TaxID=914234 RepID=M2R8P4_CERS8|nr:glycosyltransferase family 32 protein [Gelatoporia subvermispora B]